jgi:phenylacetate-CoA ligase
LRFTTTVSCLYGEARGYRRLRIRRQVWANEWISREALDRMTLGLFDRRVREAIDSFPFYADVVKGFRGRLPKPGEPVRPEEIPVWTRRDQRAFFSQQAPPPESSYVHQTSGSTSTPVTFHVTRESYEWRTAVTDRGYSWAGAEEGSRGFYLWAADQGRKPWPERFKRYVHNKLQRRVSFDVFQRMGDEEKEACCLLINRFRPSAIVGYTSMLIELARYARDHPGALRWKARTLVNAAEGLQPGQREMLEKHLVDEVYLAYGSREFMGVGMECAHHTGYHIAADNVMVEVVDEGGRAVAPGETGRIIITDLRNAATPFIRYEIGDYGAMADPEEKCPCGRAFPLLKSVDGRLQDVVYTPDGKKVTGLYITFTMRQFGWIEGYQVIQSSRDRIVVRLLTPHELTPERLLPVTELLRKKLGTEIGIEYERADSLIRRGSGKVHLVMSSIEE